MARYMGEDPEATFASDLAKAEALRAEADDWIDANPQAWEYMRESARMGALLGDKFSIGSLCEHIRWQMRTVGKSQGFKLNNDHRAWFARRLKHEVPECAPFLVTRASIFDLLEVA